MQDNQIILLSQQRAETAVSQLQSKYHGLCLSVARKILSDERDVEECVNDAYLQVWKAIPPECPKTLSAYLSRVVRNLALDRFSYNHAAKRDSNLANAFEELESFLIVADSHDTEAAIIQQEFQQFINHFLRCQSLENRTYFIRRYWYGDSVREIATTYHISEEKVKSSLFRTRNKLRASLEKEGITL